MNLLDHIRFQSDTRRYQGRGTLFDLLFNRVRNAWLRWRRG